MLPLARRGLQWITPRCIRSFGKLACYAGLSLVLIEASLGHHLCPIDSFGPFPISTPRSVAELCDLVCRAAADNQAIYPLGGQTMLDFGLPPSRPGIGLDLRGLTQIIDYPARDMTITVQAGITLAKLQELLATENQRLPIDVPQADRATLGGAIANQRERAAPLRVRHAA